MDTRSIRFTNLSQYEDSLFRKWFGLFGRKDQFHGYYIQLHKSIQQGNDSDLCDRELEVLKELLKTKKNKKK